MVNKLAGEKSRQYVRKFSDNPHLLLTNLTIYFFLTLAFIFSGTLLSLDLLAHAYSDFDIGITASLYSVGYILSNFIISKYFDMFANKFIFPSLYLSLAGAIIATPFCDQTFFVYVLRFLWGGLSGMLFTLLVISTIQHTVQARMATVMSFIAVLIGLGSSLGPFLIQYTGVTGITPFLLASIFLVVTFPVALGFKIQKAKEEKIKKHKSIFAGLIYIIALPVFVLFCISIGAGFSSGKYITIFAEQFYHMTSGDAALLLSIFSLGAFFMSIPIGILADRLGPSKVILGVSFVFILLCAVLYQFQIFSDSFYVIFFVMGGILGSIYSLVMAFLSSVVDASDIPKAISGCNIFSKVGAIGGTLIIGAVMTKYGAHQLLLAFLGGMLIIFLAGFIKVKPLGKKSSA
ncbi:MAG: MFS transporter [Alphaproteobacteria bacterium]|nr:MFS transporter [Alphaproteobacteria bacterium]MBT5389250.1 MFS transporter [Alphaproteobacteria bacterium]MBT5540504.1 MFS transporter [Alphaproteobacteria bacterium]